MKLGVSQSLAQRDTGQHHYEVAYVSMAVSTKVASRSSLFVTSGGCGGGGLGGIFFKWVGRRGSSVVDVPVPCTSSSSSPRCTFGWCSRSISSTQCSDFLCVAETFTHSANCAEDRGECSGAVLERVDAKNAFDVHVCAAEESGDDGLFGFDEDGKEQFLDGRCEHAATSSRHFARRVSTGAVLGGC